jgi:hypothetical protein
MDKTSRQAVTDNLVKSKPIDGTPRQYPPPKIRFRTLPAYIGPFGYLAPVYATS